MGWVHNDQHALCPSRACHKQQNQSKASLQCSLHGSVPTHELRECHPEMVLVRSVVDFSIGHWLCGMAYLLAVFTRTARKHCQQVNGTPPGQPVSLCPILKRTTKNIDDVRPRMVFRAFGRYHQFGGFWCEMSIHIGHSLTKIASCFLWVLCARTRDRTLAVDLAYRE